MKVFISFFTIIFLLLSIFVQAQIKLDPLAKTIQINTVNQQLSLAIDYANGAKINSVRIDDKNVLAAAGIVSTLKTKEHTWSSWDKDLSPVKVVSKNNEVVLSGISLGDIKEDWKFQTRGNKILWTIIRTYSNTMQVEDMAMPVWKFANLKTWKGGILDNGGMVWCKYLAHVGDTYGVHTGGVTFWNEDQEAALKISVNALGEHSIAAKFSHDQDGSFSYTTLVSEKELKQRYNLSRFVHGKQDVFAPFDVQAGKVEVTYELSYENYLQRYSRGNLPGIDTTAVRELLNTTGRYGVVDNRIVGANGWLTNWKCLHEPFFAQIGLALNDSHYTHNLSASLDQERDLAMLPDGRVLSRWHDVQGDEIPGTYHKQTGYYEAMWGYTIDSQTGYLINTVEQFHQTGDINWLKQHKESCERALNWLIRRDENRNGIYEMMNANIEEKKASDWIDIVWAGFENAFVNAQMYESLKLWSECEKILGDESKSKYYQTLADKLKEAFNKPIDKGGFWYPEKKQYIYWRDKDGSIHGDNLVTPVNFAAIAFGICDQPGRIDSILSQIEQRTAAEQLFHWPLVFDSFKEEEVHPNNWPFPKYENGDIFPTWGYLGIRSYVKYDRDLALKYIRNLLAQYRKDGLSSQRYARTDQKGQGSDILAGISTTITALYSDIYGIQPKWNRMGLVPHLTPELNGTKFNYTLRDTVYTIQLNVGEYELSTRDFHVKSVIPFGVRGSGQELYYYPNNQEQVVLTQYHSKKEFNDLQVLRWEEGNYQWKSKGKLIQKFVIQGLQAGDRYEFLFNKRKVALRVSNEGLLSMDVKESGIQQYSLRKL